MPTPNSEQQFVQLQASLSEINAAIKAQAEATEKEVKRVGEMQGETRAKVDELLSKQGELQARLQEAEQKLVNSGKEPEREEFQSAGKRVASLLEEKGWQSNARSSARIAMPRSAITSISDAGDNIVAPDWQRGIIEGPTRQLTIRDLLAPGDTNSNTVPFVRETGFTNNAATVSETVKKPYSDLKFEPDHATVQVIAHLMKTSKQILDDMPALASFIDARARYGLKLKEEIQFLYGTGTGNQIAGIIPQAQTYTKPSGAAVTGEQRLDRLRLALLQAALAEYPSDGIVIHETDWANIELIKDTQGRYIIGNPQGSVEPMLWRRPVVATQSINQNEFLCGSFRLGAQIFDRQDIEVVVSTENVDDFENNMVSIRCEERTALAVYRPEAFVHGELTEVAS